jgi:hypothetical protein
MDLFDQIPNLQPVYLCIPGLKAKLERMGADQFRQIEGAYPFRKPGIVLYRFISEQLAAKPNFLKKDGLKTCTGRIEACRQPSRTTSHNRNIIRFANAHVYQKESEREKTSELWSIENFI